MGFSPIGIMGAFTNTKHTYKFTYTSHLSVHPEQVGGTHKVFLHADIERATRCAAAIRPTIASNVNL